MSMTCLRATLCEKILWRNLLEKQQKMPIMLVKLNSLRGKKFSGTMITAQIIFHPVTDRKPGNSKSRESAKRTMRATQAASSSSVKRRLVAMRAFRPYEMKARSEKVIKLGSKSMHFANSFAV